MAAQITVLPGSTLHFIPPFTSITAIDATDAISAVSAWNWYFNDTLVSTNSSWQYNFFSPNRNSSLILSISSPYGYSTTPKTFLLIEDLPQTYSFQILPSNLIHLGLNTNSTAITARDTTPSTLGVTGWSWTFNGVTVSNTSEWNYTFFDTITGSIALTVTSPTTTGTLIGPQTLTVTRDFNACAKEPVLPTSWKGSTTLNNAITSYDLLADRIKIQLGWPMVNIELCDDQIFDFIDQACEWYTKYAGYTEEYLMFDANRLYVPGVGLKLDDLFTRQHCWVNSCSTNYNPAAISAQFIDCDLNNYRKVVNIFSLDPTEFSGTDTLFTMDYMFAQQTYFSYMLGGFGFDLVTWHILKDWLNLREKLFATRPYIRFDGHTQLLKIIPEPTPQNNFYGVLGCRVERPISQLVKERWVQRYALALSMIALAHIRGKYGQVTLFGGGSINATDAMTMGKEQRDQLEKELMESYGEVEPPIFFMY